MTTTLVMSGLLAEELDRAARFQVETAGVLTARVLSSGDGSTRLLAREIYWVPPDAYIRREEAGLTVASSGYVHALGSAEQDDAMAIWLHTHPGLDSSPRASDNDRLVDEQLQDLFRLRADSEHYGAIILAPRNEGFSFRAHHLAAVSALGDRSCLGGRRPLPPLLLLRLRSPWAISRI